MFLWHDDDKKLGWNEGGKWRNTIIYWSLIYIGCLGESKDKNFPILFFKEKIFPIYT